MEKPLVLDIAPLSVHMIIDDNVSVPKAPIASITSHNLIPVNFLNISPLLG